MARFRFSIDLGAFLGMRHLSLTLEEGGKPIQGIFIPTGINGIEVREDNRAEGKGNPSRLRAFVNFMQRSYSSAFLQVAKSRLISQGEQVTLYNVPAWQVCYVLPEERRKVIRAALKKRVLAEHPEWSQQEDVKGTDLAVAISRMMPYQVGDSYLMEEQQAAAPQYGTAPVAQRVSGYTPVAAAPAGMDAFGRTEEDLDLPF